MSVKEDGNEIPHEGLSASGKQALRRFKIIYVLFRTAIYVLVWGSLVGGLSVFEKNLQLLIALGCILLGFLVMRLMSTIVFEQPLEKLSLVMLRLSFFFSFCFAFYQAGLSESAAPILGDWSFTLGLSLWAVGIFLWWRARSDLAPNYYDVVYVHKQQHVCARNLYAHLRHPGYCAEWLSWVGGVFMLNRLWPAVTVPIVLLWVMGYRMWVEEKFLSNDLEGYAAYCHRVKRFKFF